MAVDRFARVALMATLTLSVAACATVEDPESVDPCELVVRGWDGRDEVTLEPPYQTTMYRRTSGVEEAALVLSGSGWRMTQVNFAGPGKSVSGNMDMSGMAESTWFATAPGTWQFRLTSGPCTRVFDVDVKPALRP
jgi:hypothetical protein